PRDAVGLDAPPEPRDPARRAVALQLAAEDLARAFPALARLRHVERAVLAEREPAWIVETGHDRRGRGRERAAGHDERDGRRRENNDAIHPHGRLPLPPNGPSRKRPSRRRTTRAAPSSTPPSPRRARCRRSRPRAVRPSGRTIPTRRGRPP